MSVYFHRGETRAFTKTAEDALLSHPNHADLWPMLACFSLALESTHVA